MSKKYYPFGLQTNQDMERGKEEAKVIEEEERVISKTDQLLEILEKGQAEFEKQFGEQEVGDKSCLECRVRDISVIYLDCGHALFCEECVGKYTQKCMLCKNRIRQMIKA